MSRLKGLSGPSDEEQIKDGRLQRQKRGASIAGPSFLRQITKLNQKPKNYLASIGAPNGPHHRYLPLLRPATGEHWHCPPAGDKRDPACTWYPAPCDHKETPPEASQNGLWLEQDLLSTSKSHLTSNSCYPRKPLWGSA